MIGPAIVSGFICSDKTEPKSTAGVLNFELGRLVPRPPRLAEAKPANATLGSVTSERSLGPPSSCQPFADIITNKVEQSLSGQRIWQDLLGDYGFRGSYSSVKRYLRPLGGHTPFPSRRMECDPGGEAQVDFGSGAWIMTDGHKRRAHVLRVILSHSRKGYSEAVLTQNTESFIRALENAFYAFGGVPRTVVIDNLKAAVA